MFKISSCKLFDGLSEKELKLIESKLIIVNFKKRDSIFREGKKDKNFYIILKGVIKKETIFEDKKFIIDFLKEGDIVGKQSIFSSGNKIVNATCETDCEIAILKQEEIDKLIISSNIFTYNLFNSIAEDLKKSYKIIHNLVFKSLKTRLIEKLIYLAQIFKGESKGKTFIDIPLTQQELADFTGGARENISKLLSELKREKVIEMVGKKIMIKG